MGVITSATGAAVQDITRVLETAWGNVTMLLYPVSVQGELAAPQMIRALDWFDSTGRADVIIIGRGGGSFEDLNCFNDEALVRRVFSITTPIISAVGHETDFTLCDFAADVREATPSTAAKRAVPQKMEEIERLSSIGHNLKRKINMALEDSASRLIRMDMKISAMNPKSVLDQAGQQIDMAHMKIVHSMRSKTESAQHALDELKRSLEALNPKNTLKRGYAIIEDGQHNTLTSISATKSAKRVVINMHDGTAKADIAEG